MKKILAISGSLRKNSSNTSFLKAVSAIAPTNTQVNVYTNIGNLPFFNPDIAEGAHHRVILNFREIISDSNAIIIASPEYAHGITGVLKNALDWLVSTEEFINKPIALINTSSRATHAYASLFEIIKTMTGKIIAEASLTIPLTPGKHLSQKEIISEFSQEIHQVLTNLTEYM